MCGGCCEERLSTLCVEEGKSRGLVSIERECDEGGSAVAEAPDAHGGVLACCGDQEFVWAVARIAVPKMEWELTFPLRRRSTGARALLRSWSATVPSMEATRSPQGWRASGARLHTADGAREGTACSEDEVGLGVGPQRPALVLHKALELRKVAEARPTPLRHRRWQPLSWPARRRGTS